MRDDGSTSERSLLVVTVPQARRYAIDAPETISMHIPAELVRSRVAPRAPASASSLVLLPTRGFATMVAPGLVSERHITLGAENPRVDDFTGAGSTAAAAQAAEDAYAEYAAAANGCYCGQSEEGEYYRSCPCGSVAAPTLNITLQVMSPPLHWPTMRPFALPPPWLRAGYGMISKHFHQRRASGRC